MKMSELDYDRQTIEAVRKGMGQGDTDVASAPNGHPGDTVQAFKRAMEDDMGEEPKTPKEIAEYKVEMAVRDCWLASAELVKLRAQDRHAGPFLSKAEGDLWSIKLRIDALIEEIRGANGDTRLPAPAHLKIVKNN